MFKVKFYYTKFVFSENIIYLKKFLLENKDYL